MAKGLRNRWVIRNNHFLSLRDKRLPTIESFFQLHKAKLRVPQLKSLRKLLRVLNLPYLLDDEQARMPQHADHISEDATRTDTQGTYLAIPIEGVDTGEEPIGVIRISNSASMKLYFEDREKSIIDAASRHLANCFRREYMSQRDYLEDVLSQQGEDDDFYHTIFRLNERILDLEDWLRRVSLPQGQDLNGLESVVSRLKEITETALGSPRHKLIALRIRSMENDKLTIVQLCEIIHDWIKAVSLEINLEVDEEIDELHVDRIALVWFFRVIEEVIKNHKRYQAVPVPDAYLSKTSLGAPLMYLGNLELRDPNNVWAPYEELWSTPRAEKGGGAKLIKDATELTAVSVEFVESNGDQGGMLVRIGL